MIRNNKLAKYITDCSWKEIKQQLTYKAELSGSYVIEADQLFASSKICNACGFKNNKSSDFTKSKIQVETNGKLLPVGLYNNGIFSSASIPIT